LKSDARTPVNPRRYDASRRRAAAAQRRQRILGAARELFTARGYTGTTMADIAGRASVSIKTVEAAFGTKGALLKQVVDVAIAGDDEPIAVIDRPIVQQLRDEPDAGRFCELYAGMVTDISARLAPLVSLVEHGAENDAEIAQLRSTMSTNRLFGARHIAGLLQGKALLRADVDAEHAADVLFLFNDPSIYRTLVIERGWRPEAFRSWLADTYRDLLTTRSADR
jgi:AcrR family transcriptional regulator